MVLQSYLSWPYYTIYLIWGVAGFWLGLLKSTCRTYAMDYTPKGKEGATSSSQQLLDSLAGGLAAGIGGMIYSLSTPHIPLPDTISLIWVVSVLAGIFGLVLVISRLRSKAPKCLISSST